MKKILEIAFTSPGYFPLEISKAYITPRLECATVIVGEGLKNRLDDLGMVQQQLQQLCDWSMRIPKKPTVY